MGMLLTASGAMLLAASGCGSVKHNENANLIVGKQQFVAKCGACHTLARANTKGTVGPNLDEAFRHDVAEGLGRSTIPSVVQYQVEYPNPENVMPKGLASGTVLKDIAAYVAYAAARPGSDTGLLASAVAPAGSGKPAVEKAGKLELEARLHHQQGRCHSRPGDDLDEKHVRGDAQPRDPDRYLRPRAGRDPSGAQGHRLLHRRLEARYLHLLLPGPRPPRGGDVRDAHRQVASGTCTAGRPGTCAGPRARTCACPFQVIEIRKSRAQSRSQR
jgi:mono/diheme cytochrome c family protein